MRKEPSPAKRCEKMRKERKRCEKSHHQRKDAKRCEKSGKDAKRAVLWKKNRFCYIELDFDRSDVIKNKCQRVANNFMTFFFIRNAFETEEKAVEKMRKEHTFM